VAFFVPNQRLADYAVLKWLTYPPPVLQAWTPAALAALMLRGVYGPFRRWELAVVAARVSMVLAQQFQETLGYAFGRSWPEPWIHDTSSLLRDGAYGFRPFHGGSAYASFLGVQRFRAAAAAELGDRDAVRETKPKIPSSLMFFSRVPLHLC